MEGFNLSVCGNNSETLPSYFLDTAFSAHNNKLSTASTDCQLHFKEVTTQFLNKYSQNLSIGLLNINTINDSKFHDIGHLLNNQLLDILIINESKLDEKTDSSHFQVDNYELLRRDRLVKGGGGVLVFVKRNLNRSNLKIDQRSNNEIISFTVRVARNLELLQHTGHHTNQMQTFFFV